MFISKSSVIMKQVFQRVCILPQYAARNFCCVLSSGIIKLESNQFCNDKLKIIPQILQTQFPVPIYSYGKCRSISDQSKQNLNLTKTTKKELPTQQDDIIIDVPQKAGIVTRFKLMYKKYWYVLIPVHVVTSIGWVGGFYYLSKSGVDIIALLQSLHVSDVLVEKFQDSNMGHYAIAYLCYKIITPIRYAVTLGGTTVSIKYLVKRGYIKPVPTKLEFIKMYEEKKANLKIKRKDKN